MTTEKKLSIAFLNWYYEAGQHIDFLPENKDKPNKTDEELFDIFIEQYKP